MEEAEVKKFPRCLRCHRRLKQEEYQLRGYGKICWEKINKHEAKALFTMESCNDIIKRGE